LTEAEKAKTSAVEAERKRKFQRTADEKSERVRVEAEKRSAVGVGGLAAEATRKSSRRKCHPLSDEQKSTKVELKLRGGVPLDLVVLSNSLKRLELKLRGGVPLNLVMIESMKRPELKLRGVLLNLLLMKSLKRPKLKLRCGVLFNLLLIKSLKML
jgi:hypothetical protein